ncbi:hypothetical protein HBH70_238150 [Parastagonospora nodorum]|nr:hypothetical protein HBH49_169960 [Parastagonospora nodorum]KAH4055844.1 hypothetical protein HBH50_243910 [Parastagonospora nodorum]KAH4077393.1 hypothetical protein HBH48_243150 [Parastagonospora nodorum]KAH4198019.1 hypothetical protein HBI95_183410 [Parastagonospora nodorum]KAH4256915.1 hypothetical protein HBI03_156810 [Parastagonospora nodorum]
MSNQDRQPTDDMVVERAPTPSTSPGSRASTIMLETPDDGLRPPSQAPITTSLAMNTSPASEVVRELAKVPMDVPLEETDKFKPYQSLMNTELTLEYGKKLKNSRVIHQEILCCHSSGAARVFKESQPLRNSYAVADKLRKDLKDLVAPCVSKEEFDQEHLENKAVPLIAKIHGEYPLKSYQQRIQKTIDAVIVEEVGKRHVVMTGSKVAFAKKDLKDLGINLRLEALQAKGVMEVAQRLSSVLREVKHQEREAAKTSTQKAAAQRRLLFPDAEHRVVLSLVNWIYFNGLLHYDDAEHLYALHGLANKLGVSVLAQKCLEKLAADTNIMIEEAFRLGMSLQELLESEPVAGDDQTTTPAQNVVQVVFEHVLREPKAPKKLVDLVTYTLADRLDPGLWETLAPRINHGTLRQIMSIILVRRQAKTEDVECLRLKSESEPTGDELMLNAPTENTTIAG